MVTSYHCNCRSICWSRGGHWQGSSGVSFPVAYEQTPLWMAFPARRCWTIDKRIQWQGALFLCLRTGCQCLWGSCWHMQLAGHPVEGTRQVLFGRHPPVLWLVSFGHSIGVAWWHSWQWDPWSSGSWHLPFHPMRRLPLAWALPGVVQCDGWDVAWSFPCMWPFQWSWPVVVYHWGGVISVIPCIFFGQGCMPSVLYSAPKNETLGRLSSNFLLFSTKAFDLGYIEEVY